MYDQKAIRRRRAVLGLLVACSLGLLTAYFGESASGGLHAVQRGFLEVVSPIQEGASRALKPVRDLFGWFGDTLDAKDERDRLRTQVQRWRAAALENEAAAREGRDMEKLLQLGDRLGLGAMEPVGARVIGRNPTLWYQTLTINRGSGDGVRGGQPVVTGDGLVGTVTTVTGGNAVVRLLTDPESGVAAAVNASGITGTVEPATGDPDDLRLQFIRRGDRIARGQQVVTAGTTDSRLPSLFPRGIPIGEITRVNAEELDTFQRVHLRPFAQLRKLSFVQVLRAPDRGPQA